MKKRIEELNEQFDEMFSVTESQIDIEHLTLKEALKSQITLQMKWDTLYSSVKHAYEQCEFDEESALSNAIANALNDKHRSYSISEAKEMGKTSQAYQKARNTKLEAKYLLEDVKAVTEAIVSRRYILNNLTSSVVSGVDSHII